jgi:MFS transporter, DHA1 family, multidrug resistance protein
MHAPRAAHPSVGMIVLLGAMTAFGAMSIDMYLPAMPSIGTDLDATPAEVQRTLSSLLLGLAAGQLVYGPWSDRAGRRVPILTGILLYVAASVWCSLAADVTQLAVARFVQGLGACSAMVVSRAVVRDLYDHTETARILSLINLVFGVAPILAPLVGGLVLSVGGWRAIFWVLTGFGAAVGLSVLLGLKESRSAATADLAGGETPFASYRLLLRNPRLLGYMLAGAFNSACLFAYIAASPDLVIGTYGVDAQHFGWIFGFNAVGLITASQINRKLLLHWRPDQVLGAAVLAAFGFGLLLLTLAATGIGGMWGVLGALFLVVSTFGFMFANSAAGALSIDPHRAGSISGLMGTLGFVVGAASSAAAGLIHDGTAVPMAAVMTTALGLSALSLFLLALRRPRAAG